MLVNGYSLLWRFYIYLTFHDGSFWSYSVGLHALRNRSAIWGIRGPERCPISEVMNLKTDGKDEYHLDLTRRIMQRTGESTKDATLLVRWTPSTGGVDTASANSSVMSASVFG